MTQRQSQKASPAPAAEAPVDQPAPVVEQAAPAAQEGPICEFSEEIPGTDGRRVTVGLDSEHRLYVIRDAAWSGFHESPAHRYVWEGGVPDPDNPGVPDRGRYNKTQEAYADPVPAVMAVAAPKHRLTREMKAEAALIWERLWKSVAPYLEPRAARHAYQYGYQADLYSLLANRPDLCDHIEVCPALGPFLTHDRATAIPEAGWDLKRIAEHVLGGKAAGDEGLAPGFVVWAQRMNWNPDRVPVFPRNRMDRLSSMRSFVLSAVRVGADMDPNGVYKLESDDEWLLANLAIAHPSASSLVPKVLANPESAVNQVEKYFPPNMKQIRDGDGKDIRLNRRTKPALVLQAVVEWAQANPEEAQRVDSFAGAIKRGRKWDIGMRTEEAAQTEGLEVVIRERQRRLEAARAEARERLERERRNFHRMYGYDPLPANYDYDSTFPNVPPEELRVFEEGGRVMRMLTCGTELRMESDLAGHCVGRGDSYIAKCQGGRIFIFTIRDKESEMDGRANPDLAYTTEIYLPEWRIAQVQGRNNKFGVNHVNYRDEYNTLHAFVTKGITALRPGIDAWLAEQAKERIEEKLQQVRQNP